MSLNSAISTGCNPVNETYLDLSSLADLNPEHATALAKKFEGCQKIVRINVNYCPSLGDEGLIALLRIAENCASVINQLDLAKINMTDRGAESLSETVKKLNSLKYLILNNNPITNFGAKFLSEALLDNTTMCQLYVPGCRIGDEGMRALCPIMKNLTHFHFYDVGMTDASVEQVALSLKGVKFIDLTFWTGNLLSKNSLVWIYQSIDPENLGGLDITNVGLNFDQSVELAKSLKTCKTLNSLVLQGNSIGDQGYKAFIPVIHNSASTLRKVNLHNTSLTDQAMFPLSVELQRLSNLTSLYLGDNLLTEISAKYIAEGLKPLTKLTTLELNTNKLNDEGIKALCPTIQRLNLSVLNLTSIGMTDSGLIELGKAVAGKTFSQFEFKSGNPITAAGFVRMYSNPKGKLVATHTDWIEY